MKKKQVTVVIPSLGTKNLNQLLKKLATNNLIKEILLSIPNLKNKKNYSYNSKKIKIINSKFHHQVKQRIICYKKIKSKYTLLLDDDVNFGNNFVKNLLKMKIQKGNNSVIGPIYYDYKNFEKIHKISSSLYSLIKRFVQTLILGIPFSKKRMGKISRAGTCYGVDPDYMDGDCMSVEWIPGGCMILSTTKLINKNYFNIEGKAYCEDLIQSYLLRKKKLLLYVYKQAKIYTDSPKKIVGKEDLKNYLNGHKLFCKYSKLNNIRVTIWRAYLKLRL